MHATDWRRQAQSCIHGTVLGDWGLDAVRALAPPPKAAEGEPLILCRRSATSARRVPFAPATPHVGAGFVVSLKGLRVYRPAVCALRSGCRSPSRCAGMAVSLDSVIVRELSAELTFPGSLHCSAPVSLRVSRWQALPSAVRVSPALISTLLVLPLFFPPCHDEQALLSASQASRH